MHALTALTLIFLSSTISVASESIAEKVRKAATSQHHISIYFVANTAKKHLTPEQIRTQASLVVTRKCGNNCAQFLAPLIEHLAQSADAECSPGPANAMVEIGDSEQIVTFSQSGRQANLGGECLFSQTGADELLTRPDFLFR